MASAPGADAERPRPCESSPSSWATIILVSCDLRLLFFGGARSQLAAQPHGRSRQLLRDRSDSLPGRAADRGPISSVQHSGSCRQRTERPQTSDVRDHGCCSCAPATGRTHQNQHSSRSSRNGTIDATSRGQPSQATPPGRDASVIHDPRDRHQRQARPPKHLDEYRAQRFDLVVTLCDKVPRGLSGVPVRAAPRALGAWPTHARRFDEPPRPIHRSDTQPSSSERRASACCSPTRMPCPRPRRQRGGPRMPNDEIMHDRYMVDDVETALNFYTKLLPTSRCSPHRFLFREIPAGESSTSCSQDRRVERRPMADEREARGEEVESHPLHRRRPQPSRVGIALSATRGRSFRNDIVEGPGGKQILLLDPQATSSSSSSPPPAERLGSRGCDGRQSTWDRAHPRDSRLSARDCGDQTMATIHLQRFDPEI